MLLRRQSEKMDVLQKVPIFQGLSARHLRLIAREAEEFQGPAGKMLARQGDMGREFILILDGSARVEIDGKQIARLGPGDFFGEMSVIDGKLRSASVIADTRLVYLVIHWGLSCVYLNECLVFRGSCWSCSVGGCATPMLGSPP
ncbi:MAG: cyclic nucleotide-binding domain-containing protein [Chloroflexi bacterium]|nr:cyclic nucleotide-binding domain-containing protein [Chloroflexota bacterium]